MDVLQALMSGPAGTPYSFGLFLFDIFLPGDYPSSPPLVSLRTTGGGKVRFNPNLYANGKVCLSLLNTWAGPSWEPGRSTLLQVLLSIQSLILVPDPYFNEPGFGALRGTRMGQESSDAYNATIREASLKNAMLDMALFPPPMFEEVCALHFQLLAAPILRGLPAWEAMVRHTWRQRSGEGGEKGGEKEKKSSKTYLDTLELTDHKERVDQFSRVSVVLTKRLGKVAASSAAASVKAPERTTVEEAV
jgi:baculoviral IAP repeat-containing protein 6